MSEQKKSFRDIQDEISYSLSIPDELLTEEQKKNHEEYLSRLGDTEEEKVDSFCQFSILELEKANSLEEEGKRLISKAKTIRNRIDYMKNIYLGVMQNHGLRKIAGKVYTLSVRESQAVAIEDQNAIPAEFWVTNEEKRLDKVMVKNTIKAGIEVPGCSLVPTFSLQAR